MTSDTTTTYDADAAIVDQLWPLARPHLADPDALDGGTIEDKIRAIDALLFRTREQQQQYGEISRSLAELVAEYGAVRARARPQLARSFRAKTGPTRFDRAAFELGEQLDASAVSAMSPQTAAVLDRFLVGSPCADLLAAIDQAAEAFAEAMAAQHQHLPREIARELATESHRRGSPMPARRVGRVDGSSTVARAPRVHDEGRIVVPATGPGAMGGAR